MLIAGQYHSLKVNRVSEYGLYMADEQGAEVLLPNRFVSLSMKVGDAMEVFVYHDSEDRLVATTERPLAIAGEVASLKVVDKTLHGAFLDWGLKAKDIFLPNRNQVGLVQAGSNLVVYLYVDNITGRVVATQKFSKYVSNENISVAVGDEVSIIPAVSNELGFRVIINAKHWGMLYANQIFRQVGIGDIMTAYITKITEDNRIDVSLQRQGYDQVKSSADQLLELIKQNGGSLPVGDDSAPDEITLRTQMSKKLFKRTAGYLLKRGDVELAPDKISLKR